MTGARFEIADRGISADGVLYQGPGERTLVLDVERWVELGKPSVVLFDPETERLAVPYQPAAPEATPKSVLGEVSHPLTAEGSDASEDGTGRGTPIVAFSGRPDAGMPEAEVSHSIDAREKDGARRNQGGTLVVHDAVAVDITGSDTSFADNVSEGFVPALHTRGDRIAIASEDRTFGQEIAGALAAQGATGGFRFDLESGGAYVGQPIAVHASQDPITDEEVSPALSSNAKIAVGDEVAFRKSQRPHGRDGDETWVSDEITNTMNTFENASQVRATEVVASRSRLEVRRLTPVECCRLQGFPDEWLDGFDLADTPKYKMLGNAVSVNAARWLASRINIVEGRTDPGEYEAAVPEQPGRDEMVAVSVYPEPVRCDHRNLVGVGRSFACPDCASVSLEGEPTWRQDPERAAALLEEAGRVLPEPSASVLANFTEDYS